MELGPIFRAMLYHRTRYLLIALEVALTLAIVVNCANMMLDIRRTMTQPSGMDEQHLLAVTVLPFASTFKDESYTATQKTEDLRLLRTLPGVRAAAGIGQIPLSGSGNTAGRRPVGSEIDPPQVPFFTVTDGALETLGVELVAGRDFEEADFRAEDIEEENENVILSQAMADRFFPDGDAVGKQITDADGKRVNTIIGVVRNMANAWPGWMHSDCSALIPGKPGKPDRYRFMVRAQPGALEDLYTRIEEELLARNDGRVVSVRTLTEVRAATFAVSTVVVKLLSGVLVLLVLVTAIGIVGLTSFSVAHRTRQIGTRRALGATREAILRYFLVENWIVISIGLAVGIGLCYGLNYALAQYADGVRLDGKLVVAGMVFLWCTGLAAALAPALRGARVAPVVATRCV
ncbi:MAG: FtsX-like permease family protein [bacterium]|nr:FtsX-like permease family protein [bacterium]